MQAPQEIAGFLIWTQTGKRAKRIIKCGDHICKGKKITSLKEQNK